MFQIFDVILPLTGLAVFALLFSAPLAWLVARTQSIYHKLGPDHRRDSYLVAVGGTVLAVLLAAVAAVPIGIQLAKFFH